MRQLLDLPLELILHTITFIPSPVDHQCLRLSCRTLFNIIPTSRDPEQTTNKSQLSDFYQTYEFRSRLFKPGNLFYDLRHQVGLCSQCVLILNRESHFLKGNKTLRIDGEEVCVDCAVESTSDDDWEEYFTCWECGDCFPQMEAADEEGLCRNCYKMRIADKDEEYYRAPVNYEGR